MLRRARRIPLLAAALALLSCGQQYKLPPAPEEGRIPTPGTYNLDRVWRIPAPTDIVVHGSYLYVIEENARIGVYLSQQREPRHPAFFTDFEGLVRPIRLSLVQGDSTFLYIADQGDSSIKRYYFRGGSPLPGTLPIRGWRSITGMTADADRNVFVALADSDRVLRYDRTGKRRMVSYQGTGYGYVIRPNGIHIVNGVLWVAATGKTPPLVQRLRPFELNTAFPGDPIGIKNPLGWPVDVTTDPAGENVFVADSRNGRVLRFEATGALEDSVYTPYRAETRVDPPILSPRYVAADPTYVFVPDSANDRIVVLKLGKQ